MHKQLIHSIVNMRANDSTNRIVIRKHNFKSSYRRQQLSAQAAIQLATQINWKGTFLLVISLRLTFGGANGPYEWSTIANQLHNS